ncbi:MAG: dihydrolipoyl dehydrogenase [Thermoleophilaceae bacterium]|nr:dihydrolipoyl dehydrogenase [Thermoleophilaceae bacterium]
MPESSYDCIVIGSGPGGYVAAIRAAQLGMSVAVIEKDTVGGRCLNYACIPAKAVLRAADVLSEVNDAKSFGIQVTGIEVDFGGVVKHRDKVVKTLTGGVGGLLKKNKIDVIEGEASLTPDGDVNVGGEAIAAKNVILATGSVARPILGLEFGERVLDTAATWLMGDLPERLCVIGAGASGTEIASAYGRLGTEVALLEALPQILLLEDAEIAKAAAKEIGKQNVKVVAGATVDSVEASGKEVAITYDGTTEKFDYLAIAAGRGADTDALGLADAGVETGEDGLVKVDGALRTTKQGVWAIGDLVPGPALAHKASDEGVIAAEDAAGQGTHPLDYDAIAGVTFCHPQVASFGMTETQAKESGRDVVVGKVPMASVGAPTVYGDRGGMIKVIGDTKYGEILGAHIVGAKAAELITELVMARELEGGYTEVARTVHPHPTFSEAVMEAARAADGWLIHG